MTEKRFTSIRKKNPVSKKMGNYIQDNGSTILKLSSLEDCKDVCEVLNEQHEQTQHLESRINDYDVALKTLQDLCERKLKENEQLKTQLSKINQLIDNKIDEFKNGDYGDLPCNTLHMFLDLKEEIGDVE